VELPRLEPLWKKYREQGLSVIAINTYPDMPGALEFFEKNGLTYPQLADRDRAYKEGVLGIYGHPSTLVLDGDLRILFFKLGFDEGDEIKLEQKIMELLKGKATDI
jgi:hypothetical protein